MTTGLVGRLAGALAIVAASGVVIAQSRASTSPPLVYSAEVDSIIHPVSADYMIETMDLADRAGATLVVSGLNYQMVTRSSGSSHSLSDSATANVS